MGATLVGIVVFLAPTFQRYWTRARTFRSSNVDTGSPPTTDTSAPADESTILAHPAISDPFSSLPLEGGAE